jgi:putative transposase
MPGARRIAVSYTVESFGLSIRRSCRLVDMCRASYAYQPKGKDDEVLHLRLKELAEQRHRFGCPRLHVMLKREGVVINHKRTERIYREEGLSLRLKKRKKKAAVLRVMLPQAEHANQRWSMDLAADSTLAGRRFRVLVIVDDYSRECPAIEVDSSIPAIRVVEVLERLAETRELPEVITVDNGPEFASKTLDEWAYRRGIKLNFIRPGRPVENAYAESFIGRLRDECLNENWFSSIREAGDIIETWRRDYNDVRPHSSLDNLSPMEFIETREKTLIHSGL